MSAADVVRLRSWFDDGMLILADSQQPNLVDLSRALVALSGVGDIDLTPGARDVASMIGAADHLVFVLVDGLGMEMIERQPAGDFLPSHTVAELRTVVPSSTAPALTSLATGLWPAEHAIPGWFTYLPDAGITATILPYVERFSGRDAREFGADPGMTFPAAPLTLGARGRLRIMPRAIAGSVYSRYSGGGAASYGYETLTEAIERIADVVSGSHGPTFTYFYVPFVDAAEHAGGPASSEVAAALARVSARLELLVRRLAGRARIVITADHGQILIPRERQVELVDDDPLLALLQFPPSCDSRLPAFHVRDGQHTAFESMFRERLGQAWSLITLDEAETLELFGPVRLSPETRRRLGDYVAICGEAEAIRYRPEEPMLGFHGGLTPEEMRVPLVLG